MRIFWLIERIENGELTGEFLRVADGRNAWFRNANHATQFARETDAINAGNTLLPRSEKWGATDHAD